ncbi:MAG: flagellar motor protein MotB [Alphaproteobacteria bacterium]|nr:flagellar motor protein MotB [Alphaproteobacteria bacterium]
MKNEQPVIIEVVETHAHHGGAWKVAYADFVTAMMAFFLLLWLLNVSTDEQLEAIAGFFDPTAVQVSQRESGAGGVMGGLSMSPEGAMATEVQQITNPEPTGRAAQKSTQQTKSARKGKEEMALDKAKDILRKKEEEEFKKTEDAIKQAIQDDPELAALSKNLIIDMTPEGLRIQIVDQDGEPMFPSGSARMFEKTRKLLTKVGEITKKLPNELSIRGHTDSVPYGSGATYTNWELSADRANSSRRVLKESGIPAERINNVVGKADTEHLLPEDPNNAQNRRISIVLLKEELTNPNFEKEAKKLAEEQGFADDFEDNASDDGGDSNAGQGGPPIGTFRRTPGQVEFP